MTNRTDNFNRADTTNNIGTPSDGGSAWSQLAGTWGISGNAGYMSSAGGSDRTCVLESSVAIVTVQATLSVAPTEPYDSGLSIRAADSGNYIYSYIYPIGPDISHVIYKLISGAYTELVYDETPGTMANGDVITLSADSGNNITSTWNAFSVSANCSDGATNTKHGIYLYAGNSNTRFDAFSITENSSGGGGGGSTRSYVPRVIGFGSPLAGNQLG